MLRSNPTLNTHFEEVSHSDIKVRINQNNKQTSYSQLFVKIAIPSSIGTIFQTLYNQISTH